MRKRRHIPPQSLVEITCRTFQNRRLLTPSPGIRDLIVGILGRGQRRYGIDIHALVFLSTHYHLLATARDALQLSRFMGFVNSNIAREIGRILDWHDHFWGRRYQAILVSHEEAAQVSRFYYLLSQGVKEGLVVHPEDWPGPHSAPALLGEGTLSGIWYDRTSQFEARRSRRDASDDRFAHPETVLLSPLPCWRDLPERERQARVQTMVADIVEDGRVRRQGKEALGAVAVQRGSPTSRSLRVERGPAPWVHAATEAVRRRFREAFRVFDQAFQSAADALRSGQRDVQFPPGSFPPALPWVPFGE